MIAAGLAPGCPAAAHRLLAIAVASRSLEPLSWSPLAMTLALAMPIAALTVIAIWAWRRQSAVAGAIAMLALYALHPPGVVIVAPLVLARRAPGHAVLTALVGALAIGLWMVTPDCVVAERPDAIAMAAEVSAVASGAIGLLVALLAAAEIIRDPRSLDVRAAVTVAILGIIAVFLLPAYDRRLTLVPSIVACWWLAARLVSHLAGEARSMKARLATVLLFALVPVVVAVRVAAEAPRRSMRTSWARLTSALERAPRPAGIVVTDAALSPWIAAWRAGLPDGAGAMEALPPRASGLADAVSTRAVFALAPDAERLSEAGLLLAPLRASADREEPGLWRVVDVSPCDPLGASWVDVTTLATFGRVGLGLSGRAADSALALVYAAMPVPASAGTHLAVQGGGPFALNGVRLQEFDLERPDDRERFAAQAESDEMDAARWLAGSGIVGRALIELHVVAAASPTLSFATAPSLVMARAVRSPWWPASVTACRSSRSQVVVGYPEAPDEVAFDVRDHAWAGQGWHDPEMEGGVAYRWTSGPQADVRFVAAAPVAFTIALDLMPISGPAREQLEVRLNGRALPRDAGRDQWHAPRDAVLRGPNTLTLAAPVVPGPPGDGRRLGLKVRGITLRRAQR
jgi:hypothetical protein